MRGVSRVTGSFGRLADGSLIYLSSSTTGSRWLSEWQGPSIPLGSQSSLPYLWRKHTLFRCVSTLIKHQAQPITLSARRPRAIFKGILASSFCGPLSRASCLVFWLRWSLEDITVRKGEMCLAQGRIIHSRRMCNAGETGANN